MLFLFTHNTARAWPWLAWGWVSKDIEPIGHTCIGFRACGGWYIQNLQDGPASWGPRDELMLYFRLEVQQLRLLQNLLGEDRLLFCSGLTGLDDAQSLWEGQPTLLNPRIQILTSSRNTSQIHLEQCLSGHSCGSLQLTQDYPLLGLIWRPQHRQPQQTSKNQ